MSFAQLLVLPFARERSGLSSNAALNFSDLSARALYDCNSRQSQALPDKIETSCQGMGAGSCGLCIKDWTRAQFASIILNNINITVRNVISALHVVLLSWLPTDAVVPSQHLVPSLVGMAARAANFLDFNFHIYFGCHAVALMSERAHSISDDLLQRLLVDSAAASTAKALGQ